MNGASDYYNTRPPAPPKTKAKNIKLNHYDKVNTDVTIIRI